ncbi:MAG: DUF4363 family protein [Oscillospiraceae bacterium]|nr:DUF4363 family protein [Oscillospiraceae bacterium]
MKPTRMKIAAAVLSAIVILLAVSHLTVARECRRILNAVEAVAVSEQSDMDSAVIGTNIETLQNRWRHTYLVLRLFIPTTELEEADTLIARLPALQQAGCEELCADCAAISASILRISRSQFYVL